MTNTARPMSQVGDPSINPIWRTAQTRLIQENEHLDDASGAKKATMQLEHDDALTAQLAVADEP